MARGSVTSESVHEGAEGKPGCTVCRSGAARAAAVTWKERREEIGWGLEPESRESEEGLRVGSRIRNQDSDQGRRIHVATVTPMPLSHGTLSD